MWAYQRHTHCTRVHSPRAPCTCAFIFTCMYINIYMYTYVNIHIYIYIGASTLHSLYSCTSAPCHIFILLYTHTRTYIHIYICV